MLKRPNQVLIRFSDDEFKILTNLRIERVNKTKKIFTINNLLREMLVDMLNKKGS